jgi:hypothetical protein
MILPAPIKSSTPTASWHQKVDLHGDKHKETQPIQAEHLEFLTRTPYLQELTGGHRQRSRENEPQDILRARRGGEAAGVVPVAWGRGKQAVQIEHSRRRPL